MEKTCSGCEKVLGVEHFSKNRSALDGRSSKCKVCVFEGRDKIRERARVMAARGFAGAFVELPGGTRKGGARQERMFSMRLKVFTVNGKMLLDYIEIKTKRDSVPVRLRPVVQEDKNVYGHWVELLLMDKILGGCEEDA